VCQKRTGGPFLHNLFAQSMELDRLWDGTAGSILCPQSQMRTGEVGQLGSL